MEPFATVEDYQARQTRALSEQEGALVSTRLADATAKVVSELELAGIDWERRMASNEVFRSMLTQVVCAMVERAVASCLPGVKSRQQSAGPYSFTDTMANPTGDLYLLASERRDLGIGRSRLGMFHPHIGYGG